MSLRQVRPAGVQPGAMGEGGAAAGAWQPRCQLRQGEPVLLQLTRSVHVYRCLRSLAEALSVRISALADRET